MPGIAGKEKEVIYQAPALFIKVFFGMLAVWTVATAPLLIRRFQQGVFREDWLYWFMIGFFYVFTWFWSLGLFYRIALDADGRIRMKSLRRTLELTAQQVHAIEGSRFSGGFGFIRFKLSRESAYLFCHRRGEEIDDILREIRRINPLVKTLRI
ncbi:MAG: hypothetical protein AB1427_13375 [Thermodesulfobacteriota bacterium]